MKNLIPAVHQITMELTNNQFIKTLLIIIMTNIQSMEGDNKFITQDIVKHQLYQTTILIIIKIITTKQKNQLNHTKTVSWMYKHRDKQKSV